MGTGYGFGAHFIFKNGAKKVLGIDIDKDAIAFAKKSFEATDLNFQTGDITSNNLPRKSYDVILGFDVIEHLPLAKHGVFLQNMRDLLVNGGILLLSTPNKFVSSPNRETPGNPYHFKEYKPNEFKKTVNQIFPQTEFLGVRIINEKYHQQVKKINSKFRYTFFNFFGQFKVARDLISFVPKNFRRKISGEATLPKRKIEDFKLERAEFVDAFSLLTISKKRF